MFTSNHSSRNRLFALDQALLGWKQSAHLSREESPQIQNESTSQLSDRSLESGDVWEDEEEDENEWVHEDEWSTDEATALYTSGFSPPTSFSYRALANRLENRTQGRGYTRIRQQMQSDAVETEETDDALFEPIFFSDTRSKTTVSGNQTLGNRAMAHPAAMTSPSDWHTPVPESAAFTVPDIALPEIDLPDIDLPDADLPDSSSVSEAGLSGGESSYQSLLQMIQTAREGDLTPDSEDEQFSTAQSTHTIDVEAHAIAEAQDDWEERLPDLPRDPYSLLNLPSSIAD